MNRAWRDQWSVQHRERWWWRMRYESGRWQMLNFFGWLKLMRQWI